MKFTHTEYEDYEDGRQELDPVAKVAFYPVKDAVPLSKAHIRGWVEEGVQYLRDNPDAGHTFFESGDSLVIIFREDDGDMTHFSFTVAKRFQTGYVTVRE